MVIKGIEYNAINVGAKSAMDGLTNVRVSLHQRHPGEHAHCTGTLFFLIFSSTHNKGLQVTTRASFIYTGVIFPLQFVHRMILSAIHLSRIMNVS
jgi:hypothetical protein